MKEFNILNYIPPINFTKYIPRYIDYNLICSLNYIIRKN